MSELDEAWALALAEAEAQARAIGRHDITEYLALRNANDLMRKVGSDWLLTTFNTIAGEANSSGASIQISRDDSYRFKVDNASMVGTQLRLENGVRVLSVEVGWPRTPRDGFIRGGGLACGNLKHLGMKTASQQIRLILDPAGSPVWIAIAKHGHHHELHEADLRNHVSVLLHHSRRPRIVS